ncbi:hypothetical protein [Aquisalibacillus elongatus]|uniref:Uncharacterized protein n=1 Tax=Aquisalibacillus elongatus TaxID=485577 RepID=A0A3N5BAA8_9BACI|nr:hypothetical protein [Aquisalibacillus elongatus]RPF54343.1 hypothetical protein EDC24_1541 [Aquisalibacillus elongatus]
MRKLLLVLAIFIFYIVTNSLQQVDRILHHEVETELETDEEEKTPWVDDTLNAEDAWLSKPNVNQIKSKYKSEFERLTEDTLSYINDLKEDILAEVNNKDTNTLTLGMTILKYEKKATQLEEEIDTSYQKLFQEYQSELRRNGYSTTHVKQLKRQYSETKSDIKDDLYQEANAWIEEQKRF